MNSGRFIIFFSVIMVLYGTLHVYAVSRIWPFLGPQQWMKTSLIGLAMFLFLSYPLGRFLERYYLNVFSHGMVTFGAFWMAAIVYLVIGLAFVHAASKWVPALPFIWASLGVGLMTLTLIIWGHWNATNSKVSTFDLVVDKPLPKPEFRLVVVSDIHMGTIVSKERVRILVEEINALSADLVLLPGDMLDEDLKPVVQGNLGAYLTRIQSRYGVYASTGNHEYIGGVNLGVRYLEDHGVRVLRDEWVMVADSIVVVGREDVAAARFAGVQGKSLAEIMKGVDRRKVLIVLDHTPVRLKEAEDERLDLSLSGHTHHGQFWPWNLLTKAIYEVSRGYLKKDNTHILVSSGYGTWGPPVRIGSRSEILLVKLRSGILQKPVAP